VRYEQTQGPTIKFQDSVRVDNPWNEKNFILLFSLISLDCDMPFYIFQKSSAERSSLTSEGMALSVVVAILFCCPWHPEILFHQEWFSLMEYKNIGWDKVRWSKLHMWYWLEQASCKSFCIQNHNEECNIVSQLMCCWSFINFRAIQFSLVTWTSITVFQTCNTKRLPAFGSYSQFLHLPLNI
jgi:hypothetical protein